jgi:aconitate hydratase
MKELISVEPIGEGKDGKPVYLWDIWPTAKEINAVMKKFVTASIF